MKSVETDLGIATNQALADIEGAIESAKTKLQL